MKRLALIIALLFVGFGLSANNIQITGKVKVVSIVGDQATVEFNLSWDNSWRDDFNWDAAWIFLKAQKKGQPWTPLYLKPTGHTVTPNAGDEGGSYRLLPGEVSAANLMGVHLIRHSNSEGTVNVKVQLACDIDAFSSITAADFGTDFSGVYLAAYAMEMVYVPHGPYYLGDGGSQNAFADPSVSFIPHVDNLIGGGPYTYSASSEIQGYDAMKVLPFGGDRWSAEIAGAED
jgi:hypothetical protein